MTKKLHTEIENDRSKVSDKFIEVEYNPREKVEIRTQNMYYEVPKDKKIILVPRTFKKTPKKIIAELNKKYKV